MRLSPFERVRSFVWFLIAAGYTAFAQWLSRHAARGLTTGDGFDPLSRAMLLFLLLVGYAAMGMLGQRQRSPLRSMGLARRPGWLGELALGAALGWGGMVACVLPVALFGTLAIQFDIAPHQWLALVSDLAVLALAALAEEVAFRGYPFQRLIEAMGPTLATLFMSLIFMGLHANNPGASAAGLFSTLLAGWLLALAYLRTRALWVGWGFHFAWNASMGLLFGLPVSGLTAFSPVLSTYTRGPVWLTGGGYGPEGGAISLIVLGGLLVVLVRVTRELHHQYAGPVIVAGGIPVDIDALARRQHVAGMGPEASPAASGNQLVQILPTSATQPPTAQVLPSTVSAAPPGSLRDEGPNT